MKKQLISNHSRLLTIVDAYFSVYEEDLKNTLLKEEVISALNDAKKLQKENNKYFKIF